MSRTSTTRFACAVVATIALALLPAAPASAGAITVTRFDDPVPGACNPGDCSLREAIMAANVAPGANTIALKKGTYQLSVPGTGEDGALDGDLDVSNDALTITGKGPSKTIIDSGGAATGERTFDVHSELTAMGMTIRNSVETSAVGRAGLYGEPGSILTLADVVVSGHVNNSMTGSGYGSGINSAGTLNLTDVVASGNTAPTQCCSGVFHYPNSTAGPLTARNVTVMNNTDSTGMSPANNCCSGFFTDSNEPRVLDNVTSTGNRSQENCCVGIYLSGTGPATMSDLTVLDNVAGSDCCSGLFLSIPSGTLNRATVSRNTAVGNCCAGIYVPGGTITMRNVTVSHNVAHDCCAGVFYNGGASLALNNLTVTRNSANADNAGAHNSGGIGHSSGSVLVRNTIAANNTVGTGGNGPDCSGTITSEGYNVIGSTAGCTFTPGPGDQIGVDPMLGPLADNGGPHPTHRLLPASPAINAGNPAPAGSGGTACEALDQRGAPRKNCDVGAYELVRCGGTIVNRVGTQQKDKLRGTKKRDGMIGLGSKDTLLGKKGKDALCGGKGGDKLKGGPGKDKLKGGPGKDDCIGGPGKDRAGACKREKSI